VDDEFVVLKIACRMSYYAGDIIVDDIEAPLGYQ